MRLLSILVFLLIPLTASAAPPVTPDGNMERKAIPAQYKWKLASLLKDDKAFEEGLKRAAGMRQSLGVFKGKLNKGKKLEACLRLYFKTRLLTNKLTLYANMRKDTANKSPRLKGMVQRSLTAMNDLMSEASFIRQDLLALDDKALERAYKKTPKLKVYKAYIDGLRRRRTRVLGPEAERILSLAGDNLWAEIDLNEIPSEHEKTFGELITGLALPTIKDEKGKTVQLTLSNFGKFRGSKERRVRRDTVEGLFKSLRAAQGPLASTLAGQAGFSVFLARARGYDTALEAYLNKDNIDPEVYRNLIRSMRANIAPLHRYVRLRKKAMGVKKVRIYDLYAPMVKKVEMKFPYARALKVLPAALAPLGDEYIKVLKRGMATGSGWMDLYPGKDKSSGAFSASVYGVHPYVKMNYFDGVDDLSTLAHEYGHALHSFLSMKHQPYTTFNYAPFNAEIASTFNEKLLSDYLLKNAKNDKQRLYLLGELAETIRTTIYRQTLFAEFELAIHTAVEQGTPVSAKLLNKTYGDLIRAYYGPDFTMGKNDELEWSYIPHFYYKYYVFTYATGLSSGISLADKVTKGGAKARDAYLSMLKGGSSQAPLDLLKGAGLDLTKPEAYETVATLFDATLARMEKLLDKK